MFRINVHSCCIRSFESFDYVHELIRKIPRATVYPLYTKSPLNSLKRYPLEIQHPKFENYSLGLIESVHER